MAILLSAEATKRIRHNELRHLGPDHKVIAVTGTTPTTSASRNLYMPRSNFIKRAQVFVSLSREKAFSYITGVDVNCTYAQNLGIATYIQQSTQGTAQLQNWLNATRIGDVWRTGHQTTRHYTKPYKKHRINFVFIYETWLQCARSNIKA